MTSIWTVKDILLWSSNYLKEHGVEGARLDSELLMCQALNCTRVNLYCDYDKPVESREKGLIRESLKRRAAGEPVAYILGEREFFGRPFKVNPAVLIPRPETEHLIESVLEINDQKPIKSFLDVGTGSGIIAITLANELDLEEGYAWDISKEAIQLAEENAKLNSAEVSFQYADALDEKAWDSFEKKVDILCSNPPYIAESERDIMGASVLKFEPHLALFADQEGLVFYRSIAKQGLKVLSPNGYCAVEIGASQGEAVVNIFKEFNWQNVRVIKDLAGLARIVVAQLP